jgi:hypothetical protein
MGGGMERTYDIFEVLTNCDLEWRDFAEGHDAALARARELAAGSKNEFRVMHLPTNSVVAVFNAKQSPAGSGGEPGKSERGTRGANASLRWGSFTRMQGLFRRRSTSLC